jgi:serine/threonine-protein kinase HipA
MSTRRLQVLINDQRVGTLTEESGIWGFQYTDAWCKSASGFPITSALALNDSLQRDGSTHRPVQWFFDNLLPEETLREVIGKEEGVPYADAFGLLERLGAESAGALVLLPEMPIPAPEDGNGDSAEKSNKGAIPLDRNELSRRIRQLPVSSLSSQSPKRMSLAGAQHKMVVNFEPLSARLSEPLAGSPSTHILKPNSTAPGYPNSVVNEVFTLRLAAKLGLKVPRVWRMYVPEAVFIIERFDRKVHVEGLEPSRLHVLDGSQMLNESAIYKYSSARFANLIRLIHLCRNKAATRLAMFQWIVFNTLVGNSDCHLKNISFLVDAQGIKVAPFYDLLSTAVYHSRAFADEQAIWPQEPLAMPVAGASTFAEVTRQRLVDTGMHLGLAKGTSEREVVRMVTNLAADADVLIAQMEAEYAELGLMGKPPNPAMAAERHLLRAIRYVVIEDMLARVR